jgi:hypothetical protein
LERRASLTACEPACFWRWNDIAASRESVTALTGISLERFAVAR